MQRICLFALVFVLATGGGLVPSLGQSADVRGSSDYPSIGRYDGSRITSYETKRYEELRLPSKALGRGEKDKPSAWQTDVAGELTSIRYEGPDGRSILEVMRNYEGALKANGFEIRFFCQQKDCAPAGNTSTFWTAAKGPVGMPTTWDTSVYLLAERDGAEGKLTVGMLGVESKATGTRPLVPHVAVTIVKGKPMDSGQIKVIEASEMERALAKDGRIAIYGIYFDFDKADIKPESEPQIAQLASLLKSNPQLGVLIVGHTDGHGAFDYNLSLSQRRAQAVASRLTSQHGIAASRTTPAGAGMIAPVATNRTEEGRAKNRRVEIVELVGGSP